MSFELEPNTKAKVLEVFVLSQKNRKPDEDPGAKLQLQALVSNNVLSTVDGTLKSWLFTRHGKPTDADKQGTLDGVPVVSDMPNLTPAGEHVKVLPWNEKLTGYSLTIDQGIGGQSNIVIDDCTMSNIKIYPQSGGGAVLIKFDLESPNVSDKTWGRLARLKSTEVEIALYAPTVVDQQQSVDERSPHWPFPNKAGEAPPQSATVEKLSSARKAKAGDAATDAFVAAHPNG